MEKVYNIEILRMLSLSEEQIKEILKENKHYIKRDKKDILDLKNLMEDSRYFNEANKLVDKNIEISLKNKINRLNRKLKELNNSNIAIKTDLIERNPFILNKDSFEIYNFIESEKKKGNNIKDILELIEIDPYYID